MKSDLYEDSVSFPKFQYDPDAYLSKVVDKKAIQILSMGGPTLVAITEDHHLDLLTWSALYDDKDLRSLRRYPFKKGIAKARRVRQARKALERSNGLSPEARKKRVRSITRRMCAGKIW